MTDQRRPSPGTLIVGASQSGVQVAVTMRELGYSDPITIVGAENQLPYQLPPLSKAFLSGTADEESLELRTAAFYADKGIRLVLGEQVGEIRFDGTAGEAVTDAGRVLSFDLLALTVGAAARRLALPGVELSGVGYLRNMADARRLQADLATAESVAVIGGGFIGLEAAAAARSFGKNVTVLETADRLIARAVAPEVSEFYRAAHERRGTTVRLGVSVTGLVGSNGRVTGVALEDGEVVAAEVVLIGIGVVPRLEIAEQLGLECQGGIVVDEFARTSLPGVVAAGDCAVMPNPLTGEGRVRLESMQNAVDQAKVAAATLVGQPAKYHAVPWFWSDQGNLKLQIAGLSTGYDQIVLRGDQQAEKFSVLYYRAGHLLAIDSVNSVPDYMTVRRALAQGGQIPAGLAADSSVPLKSIVVSAAPAAGVLA